MRRLTDRLRLWLLERELRMVQGDIARMQQDLRVLIPAWRARAASLQARITLLNARHRPTHAQGGPQ